MSRLAQAVFAILVTGPLLIVSSGAIPAEANETATPSPPVVIGETTTSGVQLQGKQRKKGRLDVGTPARKSNPKRSTHTPTQAQRPQDPTTITTSLTSKKTTRLNVGICGRE